METIPKSKVKEIMHPKSAWTESQKMKFARDLQSGKVAVDPKRKPHQ